MLSFILCVSGVNGVESLQLSGELRLHGVLGLMGLKHQQGRVTHIIDL